MSNKISKNKSMKTTKKLNILLIEDDYLDVESVKRALKKIKLDHNLYVAHNGADGLAMLTGNSSDRARIVPDVIILDINMPKMNGLEFLRIVKSYYSFSNIKIFILTTSAEDYDKIAARNLGVDGYILKPLDFNKGQSQDSLKLLSELVNETA
jgi:CheY-like chemotaxis protein